MDEQGLDAALLFPTLGCGVEEALRDDIAATMASLAAFNRWLEEDWGFDYQATHPGRADALAGRPRRGGGRGRLAARARRAHRARAARARARPERHRAGRSATSCHDPVWARLAEACVPVAFHLGDSGYEARFGSAWGGRADFGFGNSDPLGHVMTDGARSTTRSPRSSSTVSSSATRPSRRQHRERLGLDAPARQAPSQAGQPDAVGVRWRTRSRRSAGTSGSRRTSRRTFTRWPSSSVSSGSCSAPTGRTARASPSPSTSPRSSDGFDEHAVQRIMRDNCLELLGPAA